VKVLIAGGHGQIALRLTRLLSARGDHVTSLIRNPEHEPDIKDAGAVALTYDLETTTLVELSSAIRGADAVVFAAGAGPGSGAARKLTVDRDGAIKLLEAAAKADIPRYVMVSASSVEDATDGDSVFEVYLRAKAQADAAVAASDRDWTILRPGGLTDDPGSGTVRIGSDPFRGSVPRDDVASVIAELLPDERSNKKILYLSSGPDAITAALDAALASAD
jgi:nucleoside-diphosphate-sugar epimerase